MSGSPRISVVVTAHREGLLAVATFRSLEKAIDRAAARGFRVEVLVALDKADAMTSEIVSEWASNRAGVQVLASSFGDPSLARNLCVRQGTGDFVAMLDADDLFGGGWLELAVAAAIADPRLIVWHPEVNLVFGETDHIFRHIDMESDEFELLSMAVSNPWTSLCFSRREVFSAVPYPESDFLGGIGHEDWGWNRRVIEYGYIHKVVKGTAHAIRRKPVSYVKRAAAAKALPAPTTLFRKELERRETIMAARRTLGL